MLEIVCNRCDRHGRLSTARLLREHGNIPGPVLLERLSADCPRRQAMPAGSSPTCAGSTRRSWRGCSDKGGRAGEAAVALAHIVCMEMKPSNAGPKPRRALGTGGYHVKTLSR